MRSGYRSSYPRKWRSCARRVDLTVDLEIEAYQTIIPGQTRECDVANHTKKRMAELGVGDSWSPDQNPNVNSGFPRGHSGPTEKVIVPGDFIQTDFGIKVFGVWCTDYQRFAYVLAPGQTEPPPEDLKKVGECRTRQSSGARGDETGDPWL